MSLMFKSPFFSMPQQLIRSGIYRELSPSSVSLYLALCHEAERRSSVRMCVTDDQISALVATSARSLQSARRQLAKFQLLSYSRHDGGKIWYTLHEPEDWIFEHLGAAFSSREARTEAPSSVVVSHQLETTNEIAGVHWNDIASVAFPFGANA